MAGVLAWLIAGLSTGLIFPGSLSGLIALAGLVAGLSTGLVFPGGLPGLPALAGLISSLLAWQPFAGSLPGLIALARLVAGLAIRLAFPGSLSRLIALAGLISGLLAWQPFARILACGIAGTVRRATIFPGGLLGKALQFVAGIAERLGLIAENAFGGSFDFAGQIGNPFGGAFGSRAVAVAGAHLFERLRHPSLFRLPQGFG